MGKEGWEGRRGRRGRGRGRKGIRALDSFEAGLVQILPGSKIVRSRRMVERDAGEIAGAAPAAEERQNKMVLFDDEARNGSVKTEPID